MNYTYFYVWIDIWSYSHIFSALSDIHFLILYNLFPTLKSSNEVITLYPWKYPHENTEKYQINSDANILKYINSIHENHTGSNSRTPVHSHELVSSAVLQVNSIFTSYPFITALNLTSSNISKYIWIHSDIEFIQIYVFSSFFSFSIVKFV